MFRVPLCLLLILTGLASATAAAESGTLAGQLADTRGQLTYAGEVVVFLCDARTGRPLLRDTKQPLQLGREGVAVETLWYAITDDRGLFEFAEVPVGKYRLVAQSWSGTKGLPKIPGTTSTILCLHGVAEHVDVRAGERTVAYPRQLGRGTLRITNDPEEGNAFLLLSLHPTLGDAVLGPQAWGDEFVRQLVGVTHMERGYVTIVGTPDDRDLHAALFNYDNNPGVGAGTFRAGQREGSLRIIATWSNGHRNPPPELRALTDHLERMNIRLNEFVDKPGVSDDSVQQLLLEQLRENPRREVNVRGLGPRKLADVLAAAAYVWLRSAQRK